MNRYLLETSFPPIMDFKKRLDVIETKSRYIFDMTQALPSFPTFPPIIEGLQNALRDPNVGFYTEVGGLPGLIEKIIATHPLKSMTKDNFLITAGCNHAMYTALTTLFSPNDSVMLLEPYYFNYQMALKMLNLQIKNFPLSVENGFRFEADLLIKACQSSAVKGIILISPNNPTGAEYSTKEILSLLEWTSENGVNVILDETYLKFYKVCLDYSKLTKYINSGLTIVGSFSKSYSLTGYRVGYLISSPAVIQQTLKLQDTLIICPSHIGQLAAMYGIEKCENFLLQQIKKMEAVENYLTERSLELDCFKFRSIGRFFSYLEHPFEKMNSFDAALKLYEETGIQCLPGEIFGTSQSKFLRLSCSNLSLDEMKKAFESLLAFDSRVQNLCDFSQ